MYQKKNKHYRNYYLYIIQIETLCSKNKTLVKEAEDDMDYLNLEIEALNLARDMDVDMSRSNY